MNNEELVNDYFKEHKLYSETYKTACVEILERLQKEQKQEKQANGAATEEKECNLPVGINWVACSDRLPDGALGSYLACLENNTIHKLEYSDMTNKWWDIAMGDIKEQNPVKYWAELPKPPYL